LVIAKGGPVFHGWRLLQNSIVGAFNVSYYPSKNSIYRHGCVTCTNGTLVALNLATKKVKRKKEREKEELHLIEKKKRKKQPTTPILQLNEV